MTCEIFSVMFSFADESRIGTLQASSIWASMFGYKALFSPVNVEHIKVHKHITCLGI